jgi:peptidoglycan/xylan/chitin deacetylase (PgdA/CDA1 family)
MNNQLTKVYVKKLDRFISRGYVSWFKERNLLISVLFHNIFRNEKEIQMNLMYPQQSTTISDFSFFLDYFISRGYEFVTPKQIIEGLPLNGKYILLTFDDGCFNNSLAFTILKEYKIPSTMFISTNHIIENKSFYWDVIYRERMKQGNSIKRIIEEINSLGVCKHYEIDGYIKKNFCTNALKPVCDIDRPFTVDEIRELAGDENIYFGNHTEHHAILTNYPYDEANIQIANGSAQLVEWGGEKPQIISFPDGYFSEEVIEIAKANGIKIGLTTKAGKNFIPLNNGNGFHNLNRFILWGDRDLERQCKSFRLDYDFSLIGTIKSNSHH